MHKHYIDLSERQKIKLKVAFKKRKDAVIGLSREQLSGGKHGILLSDVQHKAVNKAIKNNKGIRLTLSHDQLVANKNGGLLNEVLEFIENNIPYAKKVTPFVREEVAPIFKEKVIPWIVDLINKELDKVIIKGSGIDHDTVNVVRKRLITAVNKKR